jgi:hypothetical protein
MTMRRRPMSALLAVVVGVHVAYTWRREGIPHVAFRPEAIPTP